MRDHLRGTALSIITSLILSFPMLSWGETHKTRDTEKEIQELKQEVKELKKEFQHMDKHLLHRPETEKKSRFLDGLEIGFGMTGIIQGSSGANDLAGRDQTDASGSLDLEVETALGHKGIGFLLIESRDGAGLTDEIETLHGVNADAVDDDGNFKLTEAWYEHSLMEDNIIFTLGKVDLTNYFDTNDVANDETRQFLADGFVNNIAVEFPEDNGPGLRLAYLPNEQIEIGLGLGESDADYEGVARGAFGIVELILKPRNRKNEGNYHLYAWLNREDHTEWKNPSHDKEKNWGIGVSLDQAFSPTFTGFLRAGLQDESISQVDFAVSLGGKIRGLCSKREEDILAFALGFAHLSDDYEDSIAPVDTDHEQMLEVYYSFFINDHFIISPDIQVIRNPAGLEDADTITTLGVRAQVSF